MEMEKTTIYIGEVIKNVMVEKLGQRLNLQGDCKLSLRVLTIC